MTTNAQPTRQFTGRAMLACLLGAFGMIIAANSVLIFTSLSTFTGETQPKSYATGLDFNRTLEAVEAQHARGWQVQSTIESSEPNRAHIAVTYHDAQSLPLEGLKVVALFARPTNEGQDFAAELQAMGEGHYRGDVVVPFSGKWNVRIAADDGRQDPFLLDYRFIAK
jgi:nitrogen fixation protein FixH